MAAAVPLLALAVYNSYLTPEYLAIPAPLITPFQRGFVRGFDACACCRSAAATRAARKRSPAAPSLPPPSFSSAGLRVLALEGLTDLPQAPRSLFIAAFNPAAGAALKIAASSDAVELWLRLRRVPYPASSPRGEAYNCEHIGTLCCALWRVLQPARRTRT